MLRYELRSISRGYVKEDTETRLLTVLSSARVYTTFSFPFNEPFTKGKILSFLGKQLKVSPGEIIWSENIEIPKI